ncbi:MAG: sigma-70 family RNA polymerase sigma factor [Oscillospiraceae bacterium]|nr:sigma-70 family RNA polymerase sigma factor [Oscillospiraceae bacterium]
MDTQIKEAQGIPRRDAPAPPEPPQETLWSRLYQSHCARMFRIARQITQNDAEAEDAVQQAFVRLLSALDTAPDPDSPRTRALLSIVTERSAIDLLRKRRRGAEIPFEDVVNYTADRADIEALHRSMDLSAALCKLPGREREVLLLRYDNGYAPAEIAALLSMTEANVKKTLQRAKARLKRILEEQEGGR